MKITFLGTSGGRIAMMTQIRATGGFVLEMDGEMLHVDPGPGALVRAKQQHVNLRKLTGVVISHAHPDHCTEAEVVIESMTGGTRKKRGVVIGNRYLTESDENHRKIISPFHAKLPEKVIVMKDGDRARIGKVEIEAVRAKHGEPQCLGFVFRGSETVGFASDGEYYEGQEERFMGCDYLILNVLRPRGNKWPDHMNTDEAENLISLAKPKTAILKDFGMLMLKANPDKEAGWIEKETGVRTIAARDGMVINSEREKSRGLERWEGG